MNMFTNYDGAGNGFGDTLVKSECDNDNISVYSSIDGEDEDTVKIIITSHDLHNETPVNIKLSSDSRYADAEVYALYGDSTEIRRLDDIRKIKDNSISIDIKPLSVTEIIIRSDKKVMFLLLLCVRRL